MITLDLDHLFRTDPHSTKVPKIVFDWVSEREKEFPLEYKISFSLYKSPEEKDLFFKFERIYTPSLPRLRNVIFPLSEGYWTVRLIGNQKEALYASGLMSLLEAADTRIEVIPDTSSGTPRGYRRINPLSPAEEEMVDIKCDRNINDEWEWRGTGQEFLDEVYKPMLN